MRNQRLLCIDLGSAYTKIAVRDGWSTRATVLSSLPEFLSDDESMLLPSVVAFDDRGATPRWLIGSSAAGTTAGEGVRVFTDWKRHLLAHKAPSDRNGALSAIQALEIAGSFLREVHVLVQRHRPDLMRLPVRLTFPQLEDVALPVETLTGLLAGAGWRPEDARTVLSEPETNAIGVFSRGRNATWTPPQQDHRGPPSKQISMQEMLDPRFARAFRAMREGYTVLTTDIGAFTTDFGLIRFDSSFKDDRWSHPMVRQRSVRLGIHELDATVLEVLDPHIQQYFRDRPPSEWEKRKKELYKGNPQKVGINGHVWEIGTAYEREVISEKIRQFANQVLKAREEFVATLGIRKIDAEALTGGGSAIEALRCCIVDQAHDQGIPMIDLRSSTEPEQATAAGAGRFSPSERDARVNENAVLVRAASAIGGASVFFE
jgi:hypothetical protein